VPDGAWGVYVKLQFGVSTTALRANNLAANEAWLKQTLDVNGLVWTKSEGPRSRFSKHVEEYFRLMTRGPNRKLAESRPDSHYAFYWVGRGGTGLYGLPGLPCGYSIAVRGKLEVGKLYQSQGARWVSPTLDFYLDEKSSNHSGPTAPVGVSKSESMSVFNSKPQIGVRGKPQPEPGSKSKKDTGHRYLWEPDERFPASTYWYHIMRDNCPVRVTTPSDCYEPVTGKGNAVIRRGPGGGETPWRNPGGEPNPTDEDPGTMPTPGDCVLPLPK